MKRAWAVSLLAALPLAAGCVTTGKFKAQQAETLAQKQRGDALDAQLAAAKKTEDDLSNQLKAKADELAALRQSNQDLQDSLAANRTQLSKKAAELIKERDELQKKLSEAEQARLQLEQAKEAELEKVRKSYEDMTAGLKNEIAAGQVEITQLKGKLTVNMVDQILFDSGSAEVKGAGQKVLDKVGAALNKIEGKDIRIEGHTDNKPLNASLREKFPTNWELSTARATAVARYLIDHAAVDAKRLVAAGYGEFRPKASNDTAEGRAQNRRIEIVLVPRD